MTHHIQQYHLHLDLNGTEADGLALQSQLAAFCADYLLPALEQAFDRCAPPGQHLIIERLEVDAGTLALDRLEHDGPAAVAQAVEKMLHEKAAQLRAVQQPATADILLKTTPQTIEEAFFYFLNTGRLPWSFRLPEGRRLEQMVLGAWAELAGPSGIPGRVRELLQRAMAATTGRQRLVWQFSVVFREKLLSTFWPESLRVLESIRTALHTAEQPANPTANEALRRLEEVVWEVVLAHLAGNQTVSAVKVAGEIWLRRPAAVQQPALQAVLERHWPGSTKRPAAQNSAVLPSPGPKPQPGVTVEPVSGSPAEYEEVSYLDNAGLVLLHPFLPRFFEGLGLAQNDQLLHPERALSLLHFLATGQPIAPEHTLTLPKLLCAVPQAQPMPADVALTTTETDEAEALLRAVVQHWTALHHTSPDALRGTFLSRAGKLSRRPDDSDWLLQVEHLSYDILLDQLPWGISMIQLPWMPQLLRVEWG